MPSWTEGLAGLFDQNMILGEGNALYATNGPILLRLTFRQVNSAGPAILPPPESSFNTPRPVAASSSPMPVASSTLTPTETALTFLGPYPPQFWETLALPNPIYSITAPQLRFCSGTHNSAGPATSLQSKTALPTGAVLWSSL